MPGPHVLVMLSEPSGTPSQSSSRPLHVAAVSVTGPIAVQPVQPPASVQYSVPATHSPVSVPHDWVMPSEPSNIPSQSPSTPSQVVSVPPQSLSTLSVHPSPSLSIPSEQVSVQEVCPSTQIVCPVPSVAVLSAKLHIGVELL